MIRSTDCFFLWNKFIAIELSPVSNGWFRYLMDNKLATMYSSGSIEMGPDPMEGRDELLDKMRRCCALVTQGSPLIPILSLPSQLRLVVGNWSLVHEKEGELTIYNSDGSQVGGAGVLQSGGRGWDIAFKWAGLGYIYIA